MAKGRIIASRRWKNVFKNTDEMLSSFKEVFGAGTEDKEGFNLIKENNEVNLEGICEKIYGEAGVPKAIQKVVKKAVRESTKSKKYNNDLSKVKFASAKDMNKFLKDLLKYLGKSDISALLSFGVASGLNSYDSLSTAYSAISSVGAQPGGGTYSDVYNYLKTNGVSVDEDTFNSEENESKFNSVKKQNASEYKTKMKNSLRAFKKDGKLLSHVRFPNLPGWVYSGLIRANREYDKNDFEKLKKYDPRMYDAVMNKLRYAVGEKKWGKFVKTGKIKLSRWRIEQWHRNLFQEETTPGLGSWMDRYNVVRKAIEEGKDLPASYQSKLRHERAIMQNAESKKKLDQENAVVKNEANEYNDTIKNTVENAMNRNIHLTNKKDVEKNFYKFGKSVDSKAIKRTILEYKKNIESYIKTLFEDEKEQKNALEMFDQDFAECKDIKGATAMYAKIQQRILNFKLKEEREKAAEKSEEKAAEKSEEGYFKIACESIYNEKIKKQAIKLMEEKGVTNIKRKIEGKSIKEFITYINKGKSKKATASAGK